MKFRCVIFGIFGLLVTASPAGVESASNIRGMLDVLDRTEPKLHHPFSLTGSVYQVNHAGKDTNRITSIVIDDGQLLISAFDNSSSAAGLKPSDVVAVSGYFGLQKKSYGNEPYVIATKVEVLGRGPDIHPLPKKLQDLSNIEDNLRLIRTTGTIIDYRTDEADPNYLHLLLKDGPTTISISVPADSKESLDGLIDAEVSVVGTFNRTIQGVRRYAKPTIVTEFRNLRMISPPPSDVPSLERKIYLTPGDILSLGKRKANGEIIAVWQNRNLLLKDDDGRIIRVRLSNRNRTLPRCGLRTTAYGYPETDQFNIILGAATISDCTTGGNSVQSLPRTCSPDEIAGLNPNCYGEVISLEGTIRNLPSLGNAEGKIGLDCDGHLVLLDVSSCTDAADGLALGCRIKATGVCTFEMNDYDTRAETPHISGLMLVLRDRDDIDILSRPPWLTPIRFLVILLAMAGVLVLILIWNASLRVLVERRGRELARHEAETLKARLKTAERTRLASELHDAVVQNLTGAALEIRAAMASTDAAPHMDLALKTINSSRAELRNCIWDLRNQALEEKDIDEAIRITLQPHLANARLQVRFNVPRRKIPDSEFHNLVSIIRELVINAVRHGHAKSIKVAGTLDEGRILFSVTDDGCGFNPESAPGMEQGHFGIEGVRERAKTLNGKVLIDSKPGEGTRVSVSVALLEEVS